MGSVLLRVYSGTILEIVIEIGSYFYFYRQGAKYKLAQFFKDTVDYTIGMCCDKYRFNILFCLCCNKCFWM